MPVKLIVADYIGKSINNLTILSALRNHNRTYVLTKCICGKHKETVLSKIIKGEIKSCGCLLEQHRNAFKASTKTHGLTNHLLFNIWIGIRRRCLDRTHKQYKNYGAKGITICNEWENDFQSFYNWAVNNGWQKGLIIDKDIKPRKAGIAPIEYSPLWCSIVTSKENNNSTIRNVSYTVDNITLTLSELANKYNINYESLRSRLKRGINIDEALKTPIKKRNTN